jgi:hypothetical protein
MEFARFMANPVGRGVRIAAGIARIASGLFAAFGFSTVVLVAVGAVAFLAGAVNFCLLAPLLHAPNGISRWRVGAESPG